MPSAHKGQCYKCIKLHRENKTYTLTLTNIGQVKIATRVGSQPVKKHNQQVEKNTYILLK